MTDKTYTPPDFEAMVKAQAVLEQDAIERDKIDQFMRDRFYNEYVKSYDDKMAARKQAITDGRAALKETAEKHLLKTGEKVAHKAITVSVKTVQKYNKDNALAWLLESDEATGISNRNFDISPYIRIKKELQVMPFKKALASGEMTWAGAEDVMQVTVSVDNKLGEYALIAELEAKVEVEKIVVKAEPVAIIVVTDEIKRGSYVRNKEGGVGLVKRVEGYFVIVNIVNKEAKFLLTECTITDTEEYQKVNKSDAETPESAA